MTLEVAGESVSSTIERSVWESEIQSLLDKTGDAMRLALSDAELHSSDIDEVVLVGGSTRVPAVQSYVASVFGRKPHSSLNPDQVVAIGAGMQADALSAQKSMDDDFLLLDVSSLFRNRSCRWECQSVLLIAVLVFRQQPPKHLPHMQTVKRA